MLAAGCGPSGDAAQAADEPPPPQERVASEPTEDGGTRERTERLLDGEWRVDGPARTVDADGDVVAEGMLTDGVRNGAWVTRHPGGAIASRGSYLLGEREGIWVFRTPTGALDEERTGVYESGERIAPWYEEGTRTGRLKSGDTQQATYRHGLRNGPAVGFHPGGARESEGSYKDGLRDGPWRYWLPTGEVDAARTGVYRLDVKVAELGEEDDA